VTTIADVARRAGVGAATVSRVLNGSPGVAAPTRARVLAAVTELGYQRNVAARALSTGRTRTLGVIAPFLTAPSVIERLRGVSRIFADSGYQLVVFDVERPGQVAGLTVAGWLDGLLFISLRPPDAVVDRLGARGVPVVLVDGEHPRVPGVSIDDVAGGRLAAEHLLGLGHRRIAFVGDDEDTEFGFTSSARRRIGAEAACEEAGVQLVVRRNRHGRERARLVAAELLAMDEPPTAIFAASDFQALGVLDAADAAGIDVPGDLSVVGFDDVDVARYVGLSTVAQPLERSGMIGARLLLRALRGASVDAERLDLRLVARATTAPASTRSARRGPQQSARMP